MSLFLLIFAMAVVATLYSTVGHGGASGYIAVMALFGYTAIYIRQDSLMLNILVSGIAFVHYYKQGHFQPKLFLSLIVGSIPMAFLGGSISLSNDVYSIILGALILIPAVLFLFNPKSDETSINKLPIGLAIVIGCVLGFISGLTGIGGGIFLSPLLILGKWGGQKTTAAVSAAFILVNSIAGLAGNSVHITSIDPNIGWFALATVTGGIIGSRLGAGKLSVGIMKKILGVGLFIAGLKLILT